MNTSVANRLALRLVELQILSQATVQTGKKLGAAGRCGADGTAEIWGTWGTTGTRTGTPPRKAIISCIDVATALVNTGHWSFDAIRACRHVPPGQDPEGAGASYPFAPSQLKKRYL